MSGRGMKKWLPFSSLEEQKPSLQQMKYEKGKCPKPKISSDQAEQIDEQLHDYKNKIFLITYYEDGYLLTLEERIKKVDCQSLLIRTESRTISLKNLINLQISKIIQ
ncbi:MAG: YolD-like family protein [Bacilli bacterium]|jgi:hypothetical protein|nr:YolD-like family protein [Bacilli bacterium]MDD4005811.1 YolD-like family protein [Bacilli bacterium]